ncbi:hypothetical protein BSG1_15298 [Bacillus sp. SG-1]|nr:hypothetical protein BSG1_15298 [Bacillus sp. SG-1]
MMKKSASKIKPAQPVKKKKGCGCGKSKKTK